MTALPSPSTGWRSLVANPIALWLAFVLVHGVLVCLNLFGPGRPMSDVLDAYAKWMQQGFVHHHWVGIDRPWVYPILALLPMIAARLAGGAVFPVPWLAMVCLLDAIGFLAIIGWRRRALRPTAAWWWLAFLLLLGPIAFARLDAITVPIALVAAFLIVARPAIASVLMTIAVWIKVWPVALLLAMVIALRGRVRVIVAAVGTTAVIVAISLLLGAGAHVFSFVASQTSRGLQLEAPVSTIWLWRRVLGDANTRVYFDKQLTTFQVHGEGVLQAAAAMTPLLAVVLVVLIALGIRAVALAAAPEYLLPPLALAFVSGFILFNKVGSPQYFTWLAVPIVVGLAVRANSRGRSFLVPALLSAGIAAATQMIYPYFYDFLVRVDPRAVVVITVRDLLLVALFGWAVSTLVRIRASQPLDGEWIAAPWAR